MRHHRARSYFEIALRRLGFGLGLGLVLVSFVSCARRPSLVVTLSNVPGNAAELSVLVSTNERAAVENPRFDVTGYAGARDYVYSFGLHPPAGASGMISVGIGVYDRGACLITTGAGSVELDAAQSDFDLMIQLDAPPSAYTTNCRSQAVIVRSFTQQESAPQKATLLGWGFQPGVIVSVDGVPLSDVVRQDHTHLEVTIPHIPSPTGVRRLNVSVSVPGPDGASDMLSVLFYTLTFAPRSENFYILEQSREPLSVATGDLDEDGDLDFVVGGINNSNQGFLALYRNQGGGKFPAAAELIELDGAIDTVLVSDLNADGKVDIAASVYNLDAVYVFYNQGQGAFSKTTGFSRLSCPAASGPGPLAVGNFTGDSNPDLVVGTRALNATSAIVYTNQGASGLTTTAAVQVNITGVIMNDLIVRDLNLDGLPDITVSYSHAGGSNTIVSKLYPILYQGSNMFDTTQAPLVTGSCFGNVQSADFNGDGRPDLIATGVLTPQQSESTLSTLFIGQPGAAANYVMPRSDFTVRSGPFSMIIADFNRDGRDDVAITHPVKEGTGQVSILLNQTGQPGQAGKPILPEVDVPLYTVGTSDTNIASGDLNGDGKVDFVVVSRGSMKAKQPPRSDVFLNTSP